MSTIQTVASDLFDLFENESNDSVEIIKTSVTYNNGYVQKFVEMKISGIEWMNTGCSEDDNHGEFADLANGDVLIAGLGLGGDVLLVKDKVNVDSVHVVESSADVIDLVWDRISGASGILQVYNQTIESFLQSTSLTFDVIWIDIYRELGIEIPDEIQAMVTLATPRLKQGGRLLFWKYPVYLPS